MKNRTLITAVLILVLSAALVIKNRGCGNAVPELEGWYEPADEINVKGKNVSLVMIKKDNNWFINEQEYPGDAELIESLERKVRDFILLDLISDRGYFDKYELTEDKGISVTVKGKGKVLRRVLMGKSGTTSNHSYMKVDDRKEIYLASGIMKSDFTLPVSDLRNKVIFDVRTPDIQSFSVNYGGRNYDFHLNKSVSNADSDKESNKKTGTKWICRGYEHVILDDSSINSILAVFSPLRAGEYPENTERKNSGNTLCRVTISSADKKIELEIFSKKNNNMNYAASSESKYIFTLGSWQTEKLFIKRITDLAVK